MVRIQPESFGLVCPAFADVFVRGEAAQSLQATSVIVGADEIVEVGGKLGMAVVMVAFDGRLLDRSVHPFDLAVGPGMLDLRETVLDFMLVADPVEDVVEGIFVVHHIGELDAVVSEHGVDRVRNRCDQVAQELGRDHLASLLVQFDESELAGPVDRHEQPQLAVGRLHVGLQSL